jgi:hypothetical protein
MTSSPSNSTTGSAPWHAPTPTLSCKSRPTDPGHLDATFVSLGGQRDSANVPAPAGTTADPCSADGSDSVLDGTGPWRHDLWSAAVRARSLLIDVTAPAERRRTLVAVGLTVLCWRNTCLDDVHAGKERAARLQQQSKDPDDPVERAEEDRARREFRAGLNTNWEVLAAVDPDESTRIGVLLDGRGQGFGIPDDVMMRLNTWQRFRPAPPAQVSA